MTTDVITLFNQLTQDELADYSKFEAILSDHYEKFKYFYYLMGGISLTKIKKVKCTECSSITSISFTIDCENKKTLDKFITTFNENNDLSYYLSDCFDVILTGDGKIAYITIENNSSISSEEDIYANRSYSD